MWLSAPLGQSGAIGGEQQSTATSFDVRLHLQVCIYVNANITDGLRRSDWDSNYRYRRSQQLVVDADAQSPT